MLGFILSSAAKHNVDSESLSSELQQLGLPKGKGNHPRRGGMSLTVHTQLESRLAAVLSSITSLLCHQSLGAPR